MTKESALAELYNLTATDGKSKPLFTMKPTDKRPEEPPMRLTSEQQILVLGLLRFKVLSPAHFKTVFGTVAPKTASITRLSLAQEIPKIEADFIDVNKDVPFIGCFEDNSGLSKLAPSFTKLEELNTQIM